MSEIKTNKISSLASNNNITLEPDGTGDTIIASGNVGIGASSPSSQLDLGGGATNTSRLRLNRGTDDANQFMTVGYDNISVHRADVALASAQTNMKFQQIGSDGTRTAMQIDSSGKLLIGTTSELFTQGVLQVKSNGAENIARFQAASNGESIVFENASGTAVGFIQVNASATSYSTSSDYRLKTQVTYDWDATTRLKQLKPARFKWIADGDDAEFVDGFIAHELTAVPDAISGKGKDAVDDDGNPVLQGVDQSKLVPLLCKTILELEARITALESE